MSLEKERLASLMVLEILAPSCLASCSWVSGVVWRRSIFPSWHSGRGERERVRDGGESGKIVITYMPPVSHFLQQGHTHPKLKWFPKSKIVPPSGDQAFNTGACGGYFITKPYPWINWCRRHWDAGLGPILGEKLINCEMYVGWIQDDQYCSVLAGRESTSDLARGTLPWMQGLEEMTT